jgi:hypothetical protein
MDSKWVLRGATPGSPTDHNFNFVQLIDARLMKLTDFLLVKKMEIFLTPPLYKLKISQNQAKHANSIIPREIKVVMKLILMLD